MNTNTHEHNEETCWFCKSRPASPSAKHEVDLYRVLDRKATYIVVGMQYKQKYEKAKVAVPRCSQCQGIHDTIIYLGLGVWLTLGIWASIWIIGSSGKGYDSSLFGALLGIFLAFLVTGIPAGIIMGIANCFGQDQGNSHPNVEALVAEGWSVGNKPPYKW